VTKLLNDLFGIQSRAGCSCAGPYGHILLGIDKPTSLRFREARKHARELGKREKIAFAKDRKEIENLKYFYYAHRT